MLLLINENSCCVAAFTVKVFQIISIGNQSYNETWLE
jgi:hypothetical protein